MDLDEVIGIEIQRVSLHERAREESRVNGLLVDPSQESDFRVIRRFDREAVRFRSIQTRMDQGGWASAMTIVPRGSGPFPAVFILDEECRYLRFPGINSEGRRRDDFEGAVYAQVPLVSHLVGSGFAAAMSTPKTLSKDQGTMTDRDWIALIKLFKSRPGVDQESLFLVATHEFAELALRLAVQFRFAGVVIEAPREMMFIEAAARWEERKQAAAGKSLEQADPSSGDEHEDPDDADRTDYFQSETHMIFYAEHGRMLKAPTLVILAKEAPEFNQTRKTLLAALVAGQADFSAVLLDRWARTLTLPGEPSETWGPSRKDGNEASGQPGVSTRARSPFRYESDQFSRWIEQMGVFLISHSNSEPQALRLPQQRSPGAGREGIEDAFGQIEGAPATGVDRFDNEEEVDPNLPDPDTGY